MISSLTRRAAWLAAAIVGGCAQQPSIPPPLPIPSSAPLVEVSQTPQQVQRSRVEPLPAPPAVPRGTRPAPPEPQRVPAGSEPAVLTLEQVTIGTFAQIVFADVVRKNVSIDPQILSRKDLITFRSGANQTQEQLEAAAKLLLKSYGVAVIDIGGLVRVVPDTASIGSLPEIRRGAALPDTPLPLRPIFHLVDMQAVRQVEVAGFLRTLFGDRIRLQEDALRNAILISGTPDNVDAALEAIRVLDQPILAGGRSFSVTPTYSTADEFARRLFDVLTAQGYAAQLFSGSQAGGVRLPILILPVPAINAVYVFARGDAVIQHIEALAETLDRPADRSASRGFFTYAVRHQDASALADTLEQLLTGTRLRSATGAQPAAAAPAAAGAAAPGSAPRSGVVVVDRSSNTLIFQAGQEERTQIMALLQRLDQPTKAALIEVTVAEVSMDDLSQLGVEWAFSSGLSGGRTGTGGTLGGLGVGTGGFSYRVLNSAGQVRATLNALASDNRANILSSPRVMARNGELATIQVGQEVPIITSQATGVGSGTASGQLLQTVQYRSTGVILKVKPIIHSSDQIDLDVMQEVSAASTTETGVAASPTFSTRRVDTKLSLQNGATVILGGLISEERSDGNSGIPLLKDLPVLGSMFSKQSWSGRRRELVVLITPYVVSTNRDAEELTRAFRSMLRPWNVAPASAPQKP